MYLLECSSDHFLERSAYLESSAMNLECTERSVYQEERSSEHLEYTGCSELLVCARSSWTWSAEQHLAYPLERMVHLERPAVGALECTEHLVYLERSSPEHLELVVDVLERSVHLERSVYPECLSEHMA